MFPAVTAVAGVPLMTGVRLVVALLTLMLNGASLAEVLPSLTEMTIFQYVPT